MFESFTPRHIPPLLIATQITLGGLYPWLHSPRAALLKFGLPPTIASSKAAWPVIKIDPAPATAIGLALWGMYLGGHFEAMDILLSSMAWVGVVDGLVCYRDGEKGSVVKRAGLTGVVAGWGVLGRTTGKYLQGREGRR